ncbi:chromogranin-A [Mugil cephalus]|uniref:chromogranin-A n=1 Tax=Mugil cephalus TaxID=48193 RepID=UPI001FB81652|nr:chromogranin-A [Mugil cephalus]
MIGKGLFLLTILSNCVQSLPVTSSQLENDDVKVMKCIVEALADVLSRPRPVPVSQECLVTLKTDDRLVTILRHHNFLKELQQIAVQGDEERAEPQGDAGTPTPTMTTLQTTDGVADRSMLEALGGPGERSILSQKKRAGNGGEKEEKDESIGDSEDEGMQVKRENDENPGSHVSAPVDEWRAGKAEKRQEEEKEYDEKRANSQENSEEEHETKGDESEENRPRKKLKAKRFDDEDEEEKAKRHDDSSHQHGGNEEEEGEMKRGSRPKHWAERTKSVPLKKKAAVKEQEQDVPHHSKEVAEEEEGEEKKEKRGRSPEERELQMIARRTPEDRRGLEEEGSASRKSEEPEIESLAAIESELENVAQKLHEMRRG